jgi:hypothetical protein
VHPVVLAYAFSTVRQNTTIFKQASEKLKIFSQLSTYFKEDTWDLGARGISECV